METLSKPRMHNYHDNTRPALYVKVTEDMLNEIRRLHAEMNIPIRGLVLNALFNTYPHLSAYCGQDRATMERYFSTSLDRLNK